MILFRNHKDQKWHIMGPEDQPALCGQVHFIPWQSNVCLFSKYICKNCDRIYLNETATLHETI